MIGGVTVPCTGPDGYSDADEDIPRVSKHMTRDVVTVPLDATVGDAVNLMHLKGVSGLVVVDREMRVHGVVTERDIVRMFRELAPSLCGLGSIYRLLTMIGPNSFRPEVLIRVLDLARGKGVTSVMTTDVLAVREGTSIAHVNDLMVRRKVNRLVVLDEDERLVGIITRQDVLRARAGGAGSAAHR